MSVHFIQATDIVFIDTLRVEVNVGKDWWGRDRTQPVEISMHLHLKSAYLQASGDSDDVKDSVHYGHLTKTISKMIQEKSGKFDSVDALAKEVARRAFALGGDAVEEVRVLVDLPKIILLASGFSVDFTLKSKGGEVAVVLKKALVKDIVVHVIIGVNPPEREAKQRVLINITLYEDPDAEDRIPYEKIIGDLCEKIAGTSYLTLEKFVMQIVRDCCLSSEYIEFVTARAQKPSALSFAHSSGVEITRRRDAFV